MTTAKTALDHARLHHPEMCDGLRELPRSSRIDGRTENVSKDRPLNVLVADVGKDALFDAVKDLKRELEDRFDDVPYGPNHFFVVSAVVEHVAVTHSIRPKELEAAFAVSLKASPDVWCQGMFTVPSGPRL